MSIEDQRLVSHFGSTRINVDFAEIFASSAKTMEKDDGKDKNRIIQIGTVGRCSICRRTGAKLVPVKGFEPLAMCLHCARMTIIHLRKNLTTEDEFTHCQIFVG